MDLNPQREPSPPSGSTDGDEEAWRLIVATGVVVGDLSTSTIGRLASVSPAIASQCIDRAVAEGVIIDGEVGELAAAVLLAELGPVRTADIHVRVVRRLLTDGWERITDVVRHTRAAAALDSVLELVDHIDHAAGVALSLSNYSTARQLLELADECSSADALVRRARRLCRLAEAFEGLGLVLDCRDAAARAFDLAEIAGDVGLCLEAAVISAFPADWYAGDLRTTALLQRVEALDPDDDGRVALLGARAIAEMRIPVHVTDDQQVAWVTRASVAQPLAQKSLDMSDGCGPRERLIARLAWRTCHRASSHLEQRRQVSLEALDLSQQLRLPARQVEAASMLVVDGVESADPSLFEKGLSVARWVAERDGNPRLLAHTRAMQAGAAFVGGDLDEGRRLHAEALDFAEVVRLSSTLSLDQLLAAQYLVLLDEPPPIELIPKSDHPILVHPVAQATLALGWARHGDRAQAEHFIRGALRNRDEESSLLLMLALVAEAVCEIGATAEVPGLIDRLAPWSEHVAVDNNAWWHGGPVTLALAELSLAQGDHSVAAGYAEDAERMATSIGDIRSLRRIEKLRRGLDEAEVVGGIAAVLTGRQQRVLELIALGLSNREISQQLSYSVSTVKADVATILRVLGLTNRTQVARHAAEFLPMSSSPVKNE